MRLFHFPGISLCLRSSWTYILHVGGYVGIVGTIRERRPERRPTYVVTLDGVSQEISAIPGADLPHYSYSGPMALGVPLYSASTNSRSTIGSDRPTNVQEHELVFSLRWPEGAKPGRGGGGVCIEYIYVGGLLERDMKAMNYPIEVRGWATGVVAGTLGSFIVVLLGLCLVLWYRARERKERFGKHQINGKCCAGHWN